MYSCVRNQILTWHVIGKHAPVLVSRSGELHQNRVFLRAPLPLHQTRTKHLFIYNSAAACQTVNNPEYKTNDIPGIILYIWRVRGTRYWYTLRWKKSKGKQTGGHHNTQHYWYVKTRVSTRKRYTVGVLRHLKVLLGKSTTGSTSYRISAALIGQGTTDCTVIWPQTLRYADSKLSYHTYLGWFSPSVGDRDRIVDILKRDFTNLPEIAIACNSNFPDSRFWIEMRRKIEIRDYFDRSLLQPYYHSTWNVIFLGPSCTQRLHTRQQTTRMRKQFT